MNNAPCTYCGELNHRQGPNCPLWCKHRTERSIPIIKFNENQRLTGPNANQQNKPAQANVVIVEEQDVLPHSSKQKEDLLEESATVLAVTRSGKQYQKDKEVKDTMFNDPTVWEEQKKVRMGCVKEI